MIGWDEMGAVSIRFVLEMLLSERYESAGLYTMILVIQNKIERHPTIRKTHCIQHLSQRYSAKPLEIFTHQNSHNFLNRKTTASSVS